MAKTGKYSHIDPSDSNPAPRCHGPCVGQVPTSGACLLIHTMGLDIGMHHLWLIM